MNDMEKQYRVAIIGRTGHGDYGHDLDLAWREIHDADVVAVADDNPAGLAAAAKRLGADKTFLDYRKMLDAVKPQIVSICQRWLDQHRAMCIAAAERGIHIYIEKPLCRTLAEADEIVAACERTHTKLAVAFPTRYSPTLKTVKDLIAGNKIGRVLEYRGRGKEDRRGGGEDLWVLGSHVMDMIRAIGGAPMWCYASVTQNGKPITARDVVDGNEGIGPLAGDAVHAMYGMPDGAIGYFASVKNAGGSASRYGLQIYGSRGIIELVEGTMPAVKYLADASWSPGRSGARWQDVSSAGIDQPEPLSGAEYRARHTLAIRDLIAAIEHPERQPLSSVYEARDGMEMIVAAFESQRVGGPVALPLENRGNPLMTLR
ncbi:MAG TPA: Gfo/Idh/MocA family oxidoreductase [Pirellulales bacterium]|nr:Gfo/Idh/MocA family oxidoreductase [Pirellulales bacterium]